MAKKFEFKGKLDSDCQIPTGPGTLGIWYKPLSIHWYCEQCNQHKWVQVGEGGRGSMRDKEDARKAESDLILLYNDVVRFCHFRTCPWEEFVSYD